MKLVEQRVKHDPDNGKIGDCFLACLATIFEMDLDDIPKFNITMFEKDGDWYSDFKEWIHNFGVWPVVWTDYRDNKYHALNPKDYPGIVIASGPSPRIPEEWHAVVYKDGELLHDPHPDKTGINEVHKIEAFMPYDISVHMKAIR